MDDIYGADFANNDGDPMDDQMHGTHCAGTIAASGNNTVAWLQSKRSGPSGLVPLFPFFSEVS